MGLWEGDSRLFPLPIVHRALIIFISIFIGVPCALEPKRRREPDRPHTILRPPTKLTSSVWPVPYVCHTETMGRGKRQAWINSARKMAYSACRQCSKFCSDILILLELCSVCSVSEQIFGPSSCICSFSNMEGSLHV